MSWSVSQPPLGLWFKDINLGKHHIHVKIISQNWRRQCLSSEANQIAGNGEFVWVYF